jgi:hypothetical protein
MHIWSERPGSRVRELTADIITLLWLTFWISLGIRLYGFLANLAAAGRFVREGGTGITNAGQPLVTFGTDLEQLLIIVSALLGMLLVATAVVPWLNRYLPWRVAKWRRINAASRAIRGTRRTRAEPMPAGTLETLLASRAIHRLEYDELLEFTPDPFGDWVAGRHGRLARAELDRVGLRSVAAPR